MNLVRLVEEETNRALLTTNGRIIDMGVVIEAVVVAAAEVEEVRVSREDLLLLAGQDRHVGGEDGGILLHHHHLRLPELVVQATGVEAIQDDFATCQNDWNMTVVEEFRLREAQIGEALPMLLLLLYIVKVVEEGETKKEKHKLFRFVIVGPLLLLSLEGEEESIDRPRKLGWVGLGRGQIIITRMCACVCVCVLYLTNLQIIPYLYLPHLTYLPEEFLQVSDYRYRYLALEYDLPQIVNIKKYNNRYLLPPTIYHLIFFFSSFFLRVYKYYIVKHRVYIYLHVY